MEVCGACGYIHFKDTKEKEENSNQVSSVDLNNVEFKKLYVGKNLGSYYGEKIYDFGSEGYMDYLDEETVGFCPNCGTLKVSGINK